MEELEHLTNLAGYEQWGVMLALILLSGGALYCLYNFASKHVQHANEAFNNNTAALQRLTDSIESNTRAVGRAEETQKKTIEYLMNR